LAASSSGGMSPYGSSEYCGRLWGRRRPPGSAGGRAVVGHRALDAEFAGVAIDSDRYKGTAGHPDAPAGLLPVFDGATFSREWKEALWDQPEDRCQVEAWDLGCSHPDRPQSGYASFNRLLFTDTKVELEFLVSDGSNDRAVTTTTLIHERRGADGLRNWAIVSDKPCRIYDEEREEIPR
jgi:hypothetical protein